LGWQASSQPSLRSTNFYSTALSPQTIVNQIYTSKEIKLRLQPVSSPKTIIAKKSKGLLSLHVDALNKGAIDCSEH
jgi:hypothetical protein